MTQGWFETGEWFVVRPADDWAQQVRDALAAIKARNGGVDPATLRESYRVDPGAFSLMVEGLVALGVPVDAEMIDLAGLHDVGEFM
jgi:hypothetical protein